MNKLLLILLIQVLGALNAQSANKYIFQTDNKPYVELTGHTVVSPAHFLSGDLIDLPFTGETFKLFDRTYNIDGSQYKISFSSTGHLRIDHPNDILILDGIFTFMDSIDVNSTVSYKIEGTSPNLVLHMQWKNLKIRDEAPGNFVNFQMKLYQATGVFEIHYGSSSTSNQSGYTDNTGPNVGLFLSTQSFSQMWEKLWVNGMPPNITIDSAHTVAFKGIHGVPADGTVYRFVPKTIAAAVETISPANDAFVISNSPGTNQIQVSAKAALQSDAILMLTNIEGKTIAKHTMQKGASSMALPVSGLPGGIYSLSIAVAGRMHNYKIALQH